MMELLDYEARLFALYDGSSGFVWQSETKAWDPISTEFAGRVWASGSDAEGKAADYGADLKSLPEPAAK